MATVTVSVGNNNTNIDPTGVPVVAGTGPTYTVTWTTAVNAAVEVGDMWEDSGSPGDLYLVTAISSDRKQITVRDQVVPNAPISVISTNGFSRAFTTLASAEAATSTWVSAGDEYVLEGHEEGVMPLVGAPVVFNDTTLGSTGTLKVTVADGEWAQGVPGSGFRWQANADGDGLHFIIADASTPTQTIERLEVLGRSTAATSRGVRVTNDGSNRTTIRNVIVHGYSGTAASVGIAVLSSADNGVVIENCLVYDLAGSGAAYGFWLGKDGITVSNCTAYDCNTNGFIESGTTIRPIAKNCAALGNSVADYAGTWHANSTNNADGDTTAPGGGSQSSLTDTTEWTSPSTGDFTIKVSTSVGLLDNGVDLSGTFTDDITGATRGGAWDIGPYAGGGSVNLLQGPIGLPRRKVG